MLNSHDLCGSTYMKYVQDKLIFQETSKNTANPSAVFPSSQGDGDGSNYGRGTGSLFGSYTDSLFFDEHSTGLLKGRFYKALEL